MSSKPVVLVTILAAGLWAVLLAGAPAARAGDSYPEIVRISAETPAIADEIAYLHERGYKDETARVLLLWTSRGTNSEVQDYLVAHQLSLDGMGAPGITVMSHVVMYNGRVSFVDHADLRPLETDRVGHRRSNDPRTERGETISNELLRAGVFDLKAIADPGRQGELTSCAVRARKGFSASVKKDYPPFGYLLVVRRTVDAEGKNPEAEVYEIDGYSEANATGYRWTGKVLESRQGPKSIFPVSEIMDWMRVGQGGLVEGPFTSACLSDPTRPRD